VPSFRRGAHCTAKVVLADVPSQPFIDGLQEALKEIRRICIDALRTIPEVVEELHLKPVPPLTHESAAAKEFVMQFCLARMADLQLKVKYEGKTRKLASLIDQRPADEVVRALREVVTNTFEEMHNEEQHEEVLRRIRQSIGSVLPAFNDLLIQIEIEPIADPSLLKDSELDDEIDAVDDHSSTDSNSVGSTPSSGKPSPK
jgi:hypothetical protein